MGRTKAGKSQLVAALSGDLQGDGVGRGHHRTTRAEKVVRLDGFDLVDLPGVAALDGEEDTQLAVRAAAQSDAVIWLYAESLQDTEASELEDLLRKGKPVVVAYNAKWAVDEAPRRRVFKSTPGLAFRDLASHQERVAQISARAGTRPPPFIAVHARAAWWASREEDIDLRRASRVDNLVAACGLILTARATVLRIRARHDRPRRHLHELGATSQLVAEEIGTGQRALSRVIQKEARALSRGLQQASADATVQLDAATLSAHRKLRRWVKKHRDDDEEKLNASWVHFLEKSGLAEVLDQYAEGVRREIQRSRTSIEAGEFVKEKFESGKRISPRADRGAWGRVKFGLRALRRAAVASIRALGVDRGVALLVAKLGGRAVPGVGWWLVGVDTLQGLSAGVREELAAQRLRTAAWSRSQLSTCENELTIARELIASKISQSEAQTVLQVDNLVSEAKSALRKSSRLQRDLVKLSASAAASVENCDIELVKAILGHAGATADVSRVERIPNRESVVTFRQPGDHTQAIATLNDHLAPEIVSERTTARNRLDRRSARRKAKK